HDKRQKSEYQQQGADNGSVLHIEPRLRESRFIKAVFVERRNRGLLWRLGLPNPTRYAGLHQFPGLCNFEQPQGPLGVISLQLGNRRNSLGASSSLPVARCWAAALHLATQTPHCATSLRSQVVKGRG